MLAGSALFCNDRHAAVFADPIAAEKAPNAIQVGCIAQVAACIIFIFNISINIGCMLPQSCLRGFTP